MTIHYQSTRLDNIDIFNPEEVDRLRAHAVANPLEHLLKNPRWKEESAIDFTYTSAQIEGNSYTRAETIRLLKEGRTAGNKLWEEAQMIMNLRQAYDHVLDNSKKIVANPVDGIKEIHSILMQNLLNKNEIGAVRTKEVFMGGTEYRPPKPYGGKALEREADKIFSNLAHIEDPFSASVYAASNLAYLQYFEDGNKRTSRVFQNAILLANDLPPLLFPLSAKDQYLEAQVSYYETGDYTPLKGFMSQAYTNAYPLNESMQLHENPRVSSEFIDLLKGNGESTKPSSAAKKSI